MYPRKAISNSSVKADSSAALPAPPLASKVPSMSKRHVIMSALYLRLAIGVFVPLREILGSHAKTQRRQGIRLIRRAGSGRPDPAVEVDPEHPRITRYLRDERQVQDTQDEHHPAEVEVGHEQIAREQAEHEQEAGDAIADVERAKEVAGL